MTGFNTIALVSVAVAAVGSVAGYALVRSRDFVRRRPRRLRSRRKRRRRRPRRRFDAYRSSPRPRFARVTRLLSTASKTQGFDSWSAENLVVDDLALSVELKH